MLLDIIALLPFVKQLDSGLIVNKYNSLLWKILNT